MIPSDVRDEISRALGSEPRPYVVRSIDRELETGCEYWPLPPLAEADKPIHLRYQEVATRIADLREADRNDSRIEPLIEEANELLEGVHVSRKFGTPVISVYELLKLEPWKGIRREWWELRGRFTEQGTCIFLGYLAVHTAPPGNADVLIAMSERDPYEFLRIHQTQGNNHAVSTESIIAALRILNEEYGIAIVSAGPDSVEFIFETPVEADSRARIRRRLSRLCPNAEALTEGIRLGRVALWWD